MRLSYYNILTKIACLYIISLLIANTVNGQTPVANFSASPVSGCSPLIVVFQDQSTGNPISWIWDFGNGNSSTLQNPTATYFTPGTYTVSLTVTNTNGSNTLTRSQYITVNEPPVVNFNSNITSGCFPLRVQFTDLSTPGAGNTNVTWQWDLGNGATSTLQNPFAIYTTAGTFTITLRVTNDKGCVKTISRPSYITVTPGVTATFSNSIATVCNSPANISFTNNSTGPPILSYLWDFGDGNTSAALNPVHTYLSNGTFTATLITTSTAGCEDTARSTPITIGGFNTNFTAPVSACINEMVSFSNSSTPVPASSFWTFGDGGNANTINANHSFSTPGTYLVRLYNTYSTCTDSTLQSIIINPRPTADFTAPVTAKCEPPLTVNFQDLSTGGAVSWEWHFGDGSSSTIQNPSHIYTNYGSYNDTLIVTNAFGCSDTLIRPNYINIRRASISIPSLPARGCIPFTISPVAIINSVDAINSYAWDFGDGGTSTAANPTYTYTTQGTYTVKLYITSSGGCIDSLIITDAIRVGTKPIADFSAFPNPVCARQPVQFTDLSIPADEWNWNFGDGSTSLLQHPIHNYTDTGYFDVRLIATNNGCPDTSMKVRYMYVNPPIARFTAIPDCGNRLRFSFTDQSVAPLTWEWDFGDGSPLVFAQNPVHTFPALGTYNVRLIVTNAGCADTTFRLINTVSENPDFVADKTSACKIATIQFQTTNINASNIVSYDWSFGNGGTAITGVPNVGFAYPGTGNFTVGLIITDINGCTNTIIKPNYIRINGPQVNFSANNTGGCVGLTTSFTDLSTPDGVNNLVSWEWFFGDGNSQIYTGAPFQHTYNTAGQFSVKLIVTDAAGCRDSTSQLNIINATDPVPDFFSPDTLSCPLATIRFNNTSTPAGLTSEWTFGDGGSSIIASPTHNYLAPGQYDIKLKITDGFGCADSIIKTAYIRIANPVADFSVNDSISSCLPFEVQFANTSTYYSSVLWNFGPGQGTSALNNPVHYYSLAGNFPVKLIITSPGGCLDSITRTIHVFDTVGTTIDYLPLSGCKPLPMSLNSFSTGPMASYYWDFGDGYTQITTTPNVNHIYSSFGNFLPKVIMQDPSGCLIPIQGFDTLFISGANSNFGNNDSLFCDFGTVNFSDSTTFNDQVVSYNWSFGDGGISSLQNPTHYYSGPGIYTVQLAVETQLGCRDTLIKPLLIKVVQRPLIDIGGDSVICVFKPLLHSGLFIQPDTSVVSWQWNFPNGNTSAQQIPAPQIYNTAGTFLITTIATNSTGCKDTTTQNVYVNPLPVVTMPGQMTVQNGFPVTIPATYSPNTLTWLWSPSSGLSCTTCPTPDAGPKFDTRYLVYFTDENGCTNIGNILVNVICKNSNLFIPNTFSPNGDGSNDVFYPRGKGLERVKSLRIFNRWGEVVFERRDFPVNDAANGWNGTYKGNKPKADVYVYQAEVFCDNGEIIKLNGNIALIL